MHARQPAARSQHARSYAAWTVESDCVNCQLSITSVIDCQPPFAASLHIYTHTKLIFFFDLRQGEGGYVIFGVCLSVSTTEVVNGSRLVRQQYKLLYKRPAKVMENGDFQPPWISETLNRFSRNLELRTTPGDLPTRKIEFLSDDEGGLGE